MDTLQIFCLTGTDGNLGRQASTYRKTGVEEVEALAQFDSKSDFTSTTLRIFHD